jgi:ABC-2 type transport system permease protein
MAGALRGLGKLVWVEIKIFLREPMGVLGTIGIPVILFLVLGKSLEGKSRDLERMSGFLGPGLPIFATVFLAVGAVLSLVAIVSIYREGGILKRLRATPLRPQVILAAHVVVKLLFTGVTVGLFLVAGRRYFPQGLAASPWSFGLALAYATLSILAIGFVIASLVPTARFAQPIGSAILYPMLAVSGLFVPLESLPPIWRAVGGVLPLTHAVSLLRGIWEGAGWGAHLGDVGALALNLVVCVAVSARVFRWE